MAYFLYGTLRSDITFPAFFPVLRMASMFVNLSQDDIITFYDEQENKNTVRKTTYDIAIFKEFLAILTNFRAIVVLFHKNVF